MGSGGGAWRLSFPLIFYFFSSFFLLLGEEEEIKLTSGMEKEVARKVRARYRNLPQKRCYLTIRCYPVSRKVEKERKKLSAIFSLLVNDGVFIPLQKNCKTQPVMNFRIALNFLQYVSIVVDGLDRWWSTTETNSFFFFQRSYLSLTPKFNCVKALLTNPIELLSFSDMCPCFPFFLPCFEGNNRRYRSQVMAGTYRCQAFVGRLSTFVESFDTRTNRTRYINKPRNVPEVKKYTISATKRILFLLQLANPLKANNKL